MSVDIGLLGGFEVSIGGRPVPAAAWSRRQAAGLVKILALAPRRQLHREQVMDALWPDVPVTDAGPRLHKAAHFARRVLGADSVVLRHETVALFPDRPVGIDTVRFQELTAEALASGSAEAAEKALAAYGGELLPEDRYELWAQDARDELRRLHQQVLRQAGRWAEPAYLDATGTGTGGIGPNGVVPTGSAATGLDRAGLDPASLDPASLDAADLDPSDEKAHLAVLRELAARGDRRGALRHFERWDRALHRELGVGPSTEALRLRDALLATTPEPEPVTRDGDLVGRDAEMGRLDRVLGEAARGRARAVFVSGPPGVGKSALLDGVRRLATSRGWRTGHGVAAAVEGAWPYAPALEALADLCRRHPTLLDGLDDRYRTEIDRALSGRDLDWTGEGGHQRLFVATAELVRLAAAGAGALLVVDDVHEADEASLRLLHYLVRSCAGERLMLVLAHRRQPITPAFEEVRSSLLGRLRAVDLPLAPLDRETTAALIARHHPGLTADVAGQVWEVSGGLPFAVVELARTARPGALRAHHPGAVPLGMLSPTIRTVLEHVAISGVSFDTDEFLALSGLPEEEAFDCLDAALAALVIERTLAGYQFRHPLIREALLDEVPPHRQRLLHRACAERLIALGSSPARIGHHLLQAGEAAAAVPYVLRAAETEAAIGAYRDALVLVNSVLAQSTDQQRTRLLTLRADLFAATGDSGAVPAYRQAIEASDPAGQRELRARLGRVAALSGDFPTAEAALDGLSLDGGPTDATILLARGNVAYFTGDLEQARQASAEAYRLVTGSADDWQALDLLTLQGLLAHHRGEFLHQLRQELERTRHNPGLATAVFDAQLCVVEVMLYGPMSYQEVMEYAKDLRATAQRAGALRAIAFAAALLGEAAFLSGDLELAERELREAADLHREIAATAGEAHSLQRLAEVYLARDDRATANRLLQRALPLARWSPLALHLLQRVYGTMIVAAGSPEEARAVVDRAHAARGNMDQCAFCEVTFAVPAAIACAEVGDVDTAASYLLQAERSAALWDGTVWQAMILEARAHLARAHGDGDTSAHLLAEAARIYDDAGQPRDAARCRR